ncbi:cysteine desulfurase [Patescibacteria group bacterium]|nr:cysteine desulfurase [Patescibacteria group bacterium]MBU2219344.1 cysteine desulfurase [Patescibacteria group bacterium]
MKKRIYMDHAATTYMDSRVKKAMEDFWMKDFGNPSSIYSEGRKAKKALESARTEIAKIINVRPDEIIFTNGGTESDNLAILGVVAAVGRATSDGRRTSDKGHIITTKIEHHAVLNPCKVLEKKGWKVTYLDMGQEGIVKPEDVEKALQPDTILVSIMYANNEIGTIQPIAEIGKILKNHRAVFHTDACQASGYLDLNVSKLGVDLMTVNGSKIYGPKGIGLLYVRRPARNASHSDAGGGIKLAPLIYGGEQERGLRPGTENVPSIIGLAEALKIAQKEKSKESKRLTALRDYFVRRLAKEIPNTFLNGHPKKRLPNNINVSILGAEGEAIVLYLDDYGIACSTGSACTSVSLEPSHVIMALGKSYDYSHGSIRFSLGRRNTKKDIDYVMKILPKVVEKLRTLSAIRV